MCEDFVWKRENLEVLPQTQQTLKDLKWFLQGELNVDVVVVSC